MSTGWVLPEEVLRDAPTYTPRPHELADLELLLAEAYTPLTGFLGRADLASLARTGRLANGTSWPVPVTLQVPVALLDQIDTANPLRRVLVLTDPEGAPIAAVDAIEVWPVTGEAGGPDGEMAGVAGPVRRIGDGSHGPFRRLRHAPAEVRGVLPPGRVLGVIADRPLHRPQLAQIAYAARTLAGHLLVLIPVAGPGPEGLAPETLVRAVLAARDRMPAATIVAVPLFPHSDDIPPRHRRAALPVAEIDDLLDRGVALPEWHTPPAVARELARGRPPRRQRGLVVFFTGLSGAGKSTIARGLADALLETGERTVTLLDGDVVRRHLSAGLGYSASDRDVNVRRIGWVAAEAARHGGLVVCCPIAPYAAAREAAREFARAAGAGFILVHVSTPIEECEKRDRKGLYAKARSGELTGMTGVDDPYEVPTDAELTLDTSGMPVAEGVATVLRYLGAHRGLERRAPAGAGSAG